MRHRRTGGYARPSGVLAGLLVLMLGACSPGDGAGDPAERPDPAMETELAGTAVPQGDRTARPLAVGPPQPLQPRLDESGVRIFIPGLGWMETRRFWRMYEHEPHKLPPDLDLAAIHQLKQQADQHGSRAEDG